MPVALALFPRIGPEGGVRKVEPFGAVTIEDVSPCRRFFRPDFHGVSSHFAAQ
jgi:hypothetical protein